MQDTHAEYTYGKQPGLLWAALDIYYGRNIAQRALQMGKGRGQLPGQPEPVQEKVDGDHRKAMLQRVVATRYITPLREGGSLPALIEADDGDEYVVKFCGAGQGVKALVAELVAGEIARKLGLCVPELVFVDLKEGIGRNERNPEIQDLLQASVGLNLGVRYLPCAFAYNPLLAPPPDARLASDIVWFDAYVTNVDRTSRNVNMLIWEGKLWLIDHGAALYFHHDWQDYLARSKSRFSMIRQHTLLPLADDLEGATQRLAPQLTPDLLQEVVDLVPDEWLVDDDIFDSTAAERAAYVDYLLSRREAAPIFVEEAVNARAQLV